MHLGVLIVDDEEDIRLLIRTLVRTANQGLHVSGEAATGSEAIDRLNELDPGVVILDERMPGMSGIDTARSILRKRPGQRIILCSAYLDEELRRHAEEVGIKIFLTKAQVNDIPELLLGMIGDPSD